MISENIFYILVFSSLTIFFCFFLSKLAFIFKLIDYPNNRKIHTEPVPLVGGISIFISIFLITFFIDLDINISFIIYVSSIVFIFGLIDDIFDIGFIIRLITQFIASLIIIGIGIRIIDLGFYQYFPNLNLGYLSIIITVFCVVGLTNAFNFIDGIDGFCSSQLIISLISILVFINIETQYDNFYLLIILLIFCIMINLIFNLGFIPNFKIFLGDNGSTTIGFIIAWFLIYASYNDLLHESLTLWAVILPTYDMLRVIFNRLANKKNPFKPDKSHIHHLMILNGYSNLKILIFTSGFSFISVLIGYLTFILLGPDFNILFFLIWFLFYIFFVSKYFEKK
jgi:UDP-GlcNAc:undecaprenyl-phosphate/decaprenyl-phosphate GlcNAc-1-phosphate transferase